MKHYIIENIIQFVKQYPDTNFYFIFPPYFRYRYAYWLSLDYEKFYLHHECIKFFVMLSEVYHNMHVYGFEDMDFLDDIKNYIDTGHYHQDFNSFFLDCIQDKKHMITKSNMDRYLTASRLKAQSFDIPKFNENVESMIRKYNK